MTRPDLLSTLRRLGLSQAAFAQVTGLHEATINGWGTIRSGREMQTIPRWVPLLLGLMEAAQTRQDAA